jgi:hypothetical protein
MINPTVQIKNHVVFSMELPNTVMNPTILHCLIVSTGHGRNIDRGPIVGIERFAAGRGLPA